MRTVSLAVVCLSLATTIACTGRPTPIGGSGGGGVAVNESTSTGECSLVWRAPVEAEPDAGIAPFSLTAQDGSGLELLGVKSRAFVEDPLALTELHLTFRNPNDRVIEGRFEINLPPNSAISRFAMMIDGRWQEAEVVELQAARAAYEDALHRKVDPALLEKAAGNRFSARVFPIPARGIKEIIVSYSEELTSSSAPYKVYLRGLPTLQDLDVEVVVPNNGKPERTSVRKQNFMPQQDLELTMPRRTAEVGLRYDRLAVARIAPDVKLPQQPLGGVTLLFDTSASRALDFRGQVSRLVALVAELRASDGNDFPLTVAAFDQAVQVVFSGPASSFSGDAVQAILDRGPLGASDLGGAIAWLADNKPHPRVIVVSDGVATAGETDDGALRKAVFALSRVGVQRFDAVVDGGLRDEDSLRSLTTSGLAHAGVLVDARLPAPLVASRLTRATRSEVKVNVPGATWVWPQTLSSVQPGDEFLVFADLPADKPMKVELGDASDVRDVPLTTSARLLLERAWIRASIARLEGMMAHEAETDAAKADIKRQIVEMSTKYRVMSDYTALLVLETDFDYQRFGISRTALADILTVGPEGIAVVDRSRPADKSPFANDMARPIDPPATRGVEEDRGPRAETKSEARPDAPMADAKRAEAREQNEIGSLANAAPGSAGEAMPREAAAEAPSDDAKGGGAPPPAMRVEAAPPVAEPILADPTADIPAGPMATMRKPSPKPAKESAKKKDVSRNLDEDMERPGRSQPRPPPVAPITRPMNPYEAPRPGPTYETPKPADAWDGTFAAVMTDIRAGNATAAMTKARQWRDTEPGSELALLGLGEAAEAIGDKVLAARAYGSLIDLFPGRTDIRRMAGERLEALGDAGLGLAVDTYKVSVEQRPDHPASHRLYAFALLKAGKHAEAFAAALAGARRSYPWGRFAGVQQILEEDLRLIAAAWQAARPDDKEMLAALQAAGVTPDTQPTLRFVLNWETDANDVDFHIYDGKGGHAYYARRMLPTAGMLYADVTTGYGPECFTIPGPAPAFPYVLQAHYYSRGPMGYGMGKLQAIEHDGKGHFAFKEHPFVIMKDRAYVDLGRVDGALASLPGGARLPSGTGSTGGYTPPPPGPYTPPPPGPITRPPDPIPQPPPPPPPDPFRDRMPPPPT